LPPETPSPAAGREVAEVLVPRLHKLQRVVLPPAPEGVDEDHGVGDVKRHEAEANDASGSEALRPRGAAPVWPSVGRTNKQGPAGGAGAVRGGRRGGGSGDCGRGYFNCAEAEKMHWNGAGDRTMIMQHNLINLKYCTHYSNV
jgi:hypothetical protein